MPMNDAERAAEVLSRIRRIKQRRVKIGAALSSAASLAFVVVLYLMLPTVSLTSLPADQPNSYSATLMHGDAMLGGYLLIAVVALALTCGLIFFWRKAWRNIK